MDDRTRLTNVGRRSDRHRELFINLNNKEYEFIKENFIWLFQRTNNNIRKSEQLRTETMAWWQRFSQIVKKIVNTELMIKAVKQCKEFITACIDIDIDSKENTMQIIYGFIDYLQCIYDRLEKLCKQSGQTAVLKCEIWIEIYCHN